jgi:hypothetical protein
VKPIKRKLRGAQRVVALQADVLRLRAQAQALEAATQKSQWPMGPWSPQDEALRAARRAASSAMAELHSFSPKRALALSARLGTIKPTLSAVLVPDGKTKTDKATRRANRGWRAWKHEVEAAGIPLGTSKADQRKLKKARDAAKREGSRR